jgi:CRP-like cAMP-binding protein
MKRTATVRAVTSCTLYSLSRSDLEYILEVYPEMADKLQKTAEERITSDLKRFTKSAAAAKIQASTDALAS